MAVAEMETIGFIGVGRMGHPMAGRLLKAGYRVVAHDVVPAALKGVVELGAASAACPREVADRAEIIFISLPTPEIVLAVAFGNGGLVDGKKVRTVVDLSTTGPAAGRQLARGLAEKNITVVDCPVSGGVAGAVNGTLALMVAGEQAHYDRVHPMLSHLGREFYVGKEPGMGQMMKLINNVISVTSLAITSEAMVMGVKAGLDADAMIDVINAGSGKTGASLDKIPKFVLSRRFDFGFALGLSSKDFRLCLEQSEAMGVPMVVGSAVRQLLSIAKAKCGADADLTELIRPIEEWGGVEVRGKAANQ